MSQFFICSLNYICNSSANAIAPLNDEQFLKSPNTFEPPCISSSSKEILNASTRIVDFQLKSQDTYALR